MNTINYALRLRKVRLFLNISQRELSSRIGISASSISRYITQSQKMGQQEIQAVSIEPQSHKIRKGSLCLCFHASKMLLNRR